MNDSATLKSYRRVHERLRRERGRASEYPCAQACGRQATEWAYQHTDPAVRSDLPAPFSEDLKLYAPLCGPCHRALDADKYELDKICPLCGNVFHGNQMRLYCEPCQPLAAKARAAKGKKVRIA